VAHRTPPGSSALRESEATAAMFYLCESEATATNVFCAKAKRQQQMFSVRKRSDSNKCFLCESEATATKRLHVMVMSGKIDNSLEHKKE